MKIDTSEHARTILGVEGRAFARHVWPKSTRPERAIGLWSTQTWGASRAAGKNERLSVELRFDDNCRNGHHSFAITGELRDTRYGTKGDAGFLAGGCLHDDIARVFPELAPLIKWHLFDQTGPMHYIANTLHFAGNRDCWGRAPGEASAWETFIYFGDSPVGHAVDNGLGDWIRERMQRDPDSDVCGADAYTRGKGLPFEVRAHDHERDPKTYGTHYTLALEGSAGEYANSRNATPGWAFCPFRSEIKARQFAQALNTCRVRIEKTVTERSEGKARELDHARSAAVWPEATDEELMQEPEALKAALLARLPALLTEFRAAMDACGFAWEAPQS